MRLRSETSVRRERDAGPGRVVERLVRAFVEPPDSAVDVAAPVIEPAAPRAPSVAVLAPAHDAAAAGAAVGLKLTRGPAVVAIWGGPPRGPRVPATPGARRLAAKLVDRGHDATATGRLVVAILDDAGEAARISAAVDVPTVLVVAGARDPRVDAVLAAHDHVVVTGDGLLAALAADSVRALGVAAETLALPDAAWPRALGTTGVALVAPWRTAVEAALG